MQDRRVERFGVSDFDIPCLLTAISTVIFSDYSFLIRGSAPALQLLTGVFRMLPIVGFYAAILGLLAAALTINVIRFRLKHRVKTGDGGVLELNQAIRAHGNFTEQAPMMLILLATAEGAGTRAVLVHVIGIAILVSRFASAWGLTQTLGLSRGRQIGGGLGIIILVVTSLVLLLALAGLR